MARAALALAAVALAAIGAGAAAAQETANGEAIYSRCAACHALAYDRTGPRHCGLIGRRAGSLPGFDYSEAMKRSRLTWDAKTLDRFLADPMKAVPGTSMGYAGVKDSKERADLIAWLREAGSAASAECRNRPGR